MTLKLLMLLGIALINVCSNRKDSIDVDFIQDCDKSFLPWKLNLESVDKVILNHMKRGKAAGYDNLTLEHIVNSHPSLIWHLCKLFNLMLKHCYVPNDFGRGIVIPPLLIIEELL